MASCKVLLSRQFPLLNISICWNVSQRKFGKEATVLKRLGFPEKPKKPGSAYIIYISSIRPLLRSQNPSMSFSEISKQAGKMWRELDETEKQKYNDIFQKKLEEYKEEIKAYNKSITEGQKAEINELMLGLRVAGREKNIVNAYKKFGKEFNKPKPPISPYIIFCRQKFKNLKVSLSSETVKLLAQKWKELSDSEKEEYKAIYNKELEQFKKDLVAWEEKMIEKGNVDLVRMKSLKERLYKLT